MVVGVASGKGGTGKTTIAVNLAQVFGGGVQLLDCDVEEPNVNLFLKGKIHSIEIAAIPIPEVDEKLCDACGECSSFCRFNAIALPKTTPLIFPELCHGCGGCALICPRQAISERDRRIGVVETIKNGEITLIQGRLDVGEALVPPLIRAVKAKLNRGSFAILDAPPGASCPVIAAIRGTDFVLLVTEPTPFGLYDLKFAVDAVRELKIPFGVVINRIGIGDDRVHRYCETENIPILQEFPDDRRIAEAYSKGNLIIETLPEYRSAFEFLLQRIPGVQEPAWR